VDFYRRGIVFRFRKAAQQLPMLHRGVSRRVKRSRPQLRERLFNRDRYKREGPSPLDTRSTITIIPARQGAYDRRATRRKIVLAH
jgi:hypothetical protein